MIRVIWKCFEVNNMSSYILALRDHSDIGYRVLAVGQHSHGLFFSKKNVTKNELG